MFSQANFDQLPRELLFGIFSYLKPKAALTVALVNTEFQIAANLACKEKILKLRDLDQCDSDLLIWAQKKSNQAFLNFIYQLAIKKYSVDLFVDIAKRDINKKTILHWAILCRQPIDVIDLLILQGAAINALDSSNNTPLLTALENGHLDAVKLLLKKNANIHAAYGYYGVTPLFVAAKNGYLDIVKTLLEKKNININGICSFDGLPPLFIAAQNGHFEIVKVLLEKNANINVVRFDGVTPLFIAAQNGHIKSVMALLEKNANINLARTDGITPLFIAAQNNHLDVFKILLEKHPDIKSMHSPDDITQLFIAAQNFRPEVATKAFNKQLLQCYLKRVTLRQDNDYKNSFNKFCYNSFGFSLFGFSAKQKKEAANALHSVVCDGANKAALHAHQDALTEGELNSIYRRFKL